MAQDREKWIDAVTLSCSQKVITADRSAIDLCKKFRIYTLFGLAAIQWLLGLAEKKPAVKPEDKSEDGLKSEISHYSPDDASCKRPRRAVKSEAGVGSRKMKRGPGTTTTLAELLKNKPLLCGDGDGRVWKPQ